MDTCDVLIVGGGPAGSSCAWKLRRAGLDVAVLDRKAFPRDKTCAGWVTPPVLHALAFRADDYRRGRVFQPITGFRTGLIGGAEVQTSYDEPVSYGIRRCEFDHYLLERSGARLLLGRGLQSLERHGTEWIANGEVRVPLVIGAGGHFCPVARRLGNRRGAGASVVAAQEIEFEAGADALAAGSVDPEIPELFFCRDLEGYGWCFRKGDFLNIGLGRRVPSDGSRRRRNGSSNGGSEPGATGLGEHVAAFCDFLRERGKVRAAIPERFHGHAYQLYERVRPKLLGDGVLLIGDAAGLAYPQSGEGIRPAVESALIAADVILAAAGRYDEARLEPYAARLAARLGPPRPVGAADWLPAGWLQFLAARLLATRWFSRRVVLDQWFLHRETEALPAPEPPSASSACP